MAIIYNLHVDNPQLRLVKQAAMLLNQGKVLAVPTDSSYALVTGLDNPKTAERLRKLRGLDQRHHLTLLCRDLSEIATFARVDNRQYRLLKMATPGPWTFILQATKDVPRKVSHPSRKTIGIRVPEHAILLALIEEVGSPILSTTLIPEGEIEPLSDPDDVLDLYEHLVDGIVLSGTCPIHPTTVIDLSQNDIEVLRVGAGDPADLGLIT